jgi:predicted DsbA family dithiol-disulfide isomerase
MKEKDLASSVDASTKQKNSNAIVSVEIYSDIVCPWCFIGKRRFEKALAQAGVKDRISVAWRPYELNPDMPTEGIDRREHRINKFGSLEHSQELDAKVAKAGQGEGITFNHDAIEKAPNTLNGHRLIKYAQEQGHQDEVVEALFKSYFCDGVDIGNVDALVKIGSQSGLDQAKLTEFLNSTSGIDEVKEEERKGLRMGVSGVPGFVFNGQLTFSGAQDPTVTAALLKEVCKQTS